MEEQDFVTTITPTAALIYWQSQSQRSHETILYCVPSTSACPPPIFLFRSSDGTFPIVSDVCILQSSRGGISVDTEHADGQTVSRLTLAKLSTRDTGRYVCKPLSLPKAVVTIIIVEGR